MSPFLRQVRTASGGVAVQIVEKKNGRNRVVEHLGSAHDEAGVQRLREIGRARLYPGQEELDVFGYHVPGVIISKRSQILWDVLTSAYTDLGFDVLGDEAFKQLVLARLIHPTSKAESVHVLREVGVDAVSLRTVFNCLKRVNVKDYRGQVASLCFTHAATAGDVSLVLYDVTTLYFEAEKEDEDTGPNTGLRKVGYSKERRVDPQIVVGLLVDRSGFPLEIGCFEGNTAETRTMIPIITQFTKRHHISEIVVVGDAGMLSEANLTDLDKAGLRFIVGARLTKAPTDLAFHLNSAHPGFTDGQIIETITPKGRGRRSLATGPIIWDPEVHTGAWRVVWVYSDKRARHDEKTLDAQEAKARAVIAGTRKVKNPRFVSTSKDGQALDEASLARARALTGLKGYLTNIDATIMPGAEIVANYHDLWHVEQSFRMSKTDLRARPIFHHTKEAIEAHLTIVFTALAVARYLQHHTRYPIRQIIKHLRPLQDITLTQNGNTLTARDPITPTAQQILTNLQGH